MPLPLDDSGAQSFIQRRQVAHDGVLSASCRLAIHGGFFDCGKCTAGLGTIGQRYNLLSSDACVVRAGVVTSTGSAVSTSDAILRDKLKATAIDSKSAIAVTLFDACMLWLCRIDSNADMPGTYRIHCLLPHSSLQRNTHTFQSSDATC